MTIEQAIAEGFDGMRLNPDTAVSVVEKYGEERVAFVLANTLKQLPMMEDFLMAINDGQMALIFRKISAGEWI